MTHGTPILESAQAYGRRLAIPDPQLDWPV